jgi:hypothetical protein
VGYYDVLIVKQEVCIGKKDSETGAIDLKRISRRDAKDLP